jgi:CBS domain-containing protein
VYGELTLAEELREYLSRTLPGQGIFLKQMATLITNLRPPLGFFQTFIVEKSGDHKDEFNIKFRVIAPLIDIVRLFSLEANITETGTLDRLQSLRGRHAAVTEYGDDLEHAFEVVSLLRIHRQFEQIEAGLEPDNFINPNKLTNLEKKTLKEIFHLILRVQDSISKQYNPGTVM